jgi:hypothetical protein
MILQIVLKVRKVWLHAFKEVMFMDGEKKNTL